MLLKEISKEALTRPLSRSEVLGMLLRLTVFGAVTYFGFKWMVDAIDPTRRQKIEAKKRAEKLMKQIGVEGIKLSEYELTIATHLVDPGALKVTWQDIAGLDEVITELQETVILPFQKRHLFHGSKLFQPPKDSFLRNRSCSDHEATAMMKAQFMSLWDGLSTDTDCQVIVMGATNRPQDVDPAIMRRMPSTFHVSLPRQRQRQEILKLILSGECYSFQLSSDVELKEIAEKTEGYSGSDLRELCREAALHRLRDFVRKEQMQCIGRQRQADDCKESSTDEGLRTITQTDLRLALERMRESKAGTVTRILQDTPVD
ncbi:outer mitochondrial transmembrane helix translocase-like isoform X4 [Heptranchias perlo]|uniref:outer mitochondrial transmembrane helix translocase-like isoform X4 n=1 Tax=Heptranchias perlo TaxID=212740 RepID=UPI00355A9DEB